MYVLRCEVRFEYAHRLMLHTGQCCFLHGHSGVVEVECAWHELDENGFVRDLGEVKGYVREYVDAHWDHSVLLNESDPLANRLVSFFEHECGECRVHIMSGEPTAENMARELSEYLRAKLPELRRVIVRETATGVAGYEV